LLTYLLKNNKASFGTMHFPHFIVYKIDNKQLQILARAYKLDVHKYRKLDSGSTPVGINAAQKFQNK
jgi:hypothetical protein